METLLWGGFILIAGVLAIVVFRLLTVKRMVRNRHPMNVNDIHRNVANMVSLNTVDLVFRELGNAYSVDPRLIRPEDSLQHFFDLDSWDLGVGTEKLQQWLQNIGIEEIDTQPKTVLDLLILVESHLQSSHVSHP